MDWKVDHRSTVKTFSQECNLKAGCYRIQVLNSIQKSIIIRFLKPGLIHWTYMEVVALCIWATCTCCLQVLRCCNFTGSGWSDELTVFSYASHPTPSSQIPQLRWSQIWNPNLHSKLFVYWPTHMSMGRSNAWSAVKREKSLAFIFIINPNSLGRRYIGVDFITSELTWEWVRDVEEELTTLPLALLNGLGLLLLLKETIYIVFFVVGFFLWTQTIQKSVSPLNSYQERQVYCFLF